MGRPIIYIQTHPIQYAAPFFKECTDAGLQIEVWFCFERSIDGSVDKQFGKVVQWDIPLLEGYKYRFFKNSSWRPSIQGGFWGLLNVSLIRALKKAPPSLVVIHGWNYATTLFSLLLAKSFGHSVALRGESPLTQELYNNNLKLRLRGFFFKRIVFKSVDYFLYIGSRNKEFYRYYDIKESNLYFAPHAVDNKRFSAAYELLRKDREETCKAFGYDSSKKTIMFSGKFIEKKRPLDLLLAFHQLSDADVQLLFVGEGVLKEQMKRYIKENSLKNVYITGFINQSEIVKYYSISDVFVMCSGVGETWGLSVNEAMNFNLPIIVSDIIGCSIDLVKQEYNGYCYNYGKVSELAKYLKDVLGKKEEELKLWGTRSSEIVSNYSFHQTIQTLKQLTTI